MSDVGSVLVALAGAASAIGRAATLAPEAQVINATARARRKMKRNPPGYLRKVARACEDLRVADAADDKPGLISALLQLRALGITDEDVRQVEQLAELLMEDDG